MEVTRGALHLCHIIWGDNVGRDGTAGLALGRAHTDKSRGGGGPVGLCCCCYLAKLNLTCLIASQYLCSPVRMGPTSWGLRTRWPAALTSCSMQSSKRPLMSLTRWKHFSDCSILCSHNHPRFWVRICNHDISSLLWKCFPNFVLIVRERCVVNNFLCIPKFTIFIRTSCYIASGSLEDAYYGS